MQRIHVAGALAIVLAGSCASTDGPRFGMSAPPPAPSAPLEFRGYPTQANFGIVYAEAVFYTNHEDIFDDDFLDEGVIPVALKIGTRGKGQDIAQISLNPERMDLHLYLEDGTPLSFVPAAEASGMSKRAADRVLQQALRPGLLSRWDAAPEGFVFFRLEPEDDFEVDDMELVHIAGKVVRQLNLLHSLVGMTLTTDQGEQQLYVGLRADRRVIED